MDEKLNPDEWGRPLSMVVRVYELRRRELFDQLTLLDLAHAPDEQRLLGDDLVTRHEFVLSPGSQQIVEWQAQRGVRYLAWVGFYRNPSAKPWRQLVTVPADPALPRRLWVGACGLQWVEVKVALPRSECAGHRFVADGVVDHDLPAVLPVPLDVNAGLGAPPPRSLPPRRVRDKGRP